MIKVIDDYYIEIDNAKGCINYIVRRGSVKIDEKGRNRDTLLGFCGTMGQAISLIREQNYCQQADGRFPHTFRGSGGGKKRDRQAHEGS